MDSRISFHSLDVLSDSSYILLVWSILFYPKLLFFYNSSFRRCSRLSVADAMQAVPVNRDADLFSAHSLTEVGPH